MLGPVILTKNTDINNYSFSGYGIEFDATGSFLLSDGSGFGKPMITFGADMSSLVHIDNKKKDILILFKTQQMIYMILC